MRIDKFLKVSRLIKRRTIANEACDCQRITVNSKPVKASYQIKIGDVVEISFGSTVIKVKVLALNEHTTKENASDNYEMLS
ncbi:MAG: RNA-binding S4 domain-containing protein [Oscillospiraceae bacterium]